MKKGVGSCSIGLAFVSILRRGVQSDSVFRVLEPVVGKMRGRKLQCISAHCGAIFLSCSLTLQQRVTRSNHQARWNRPAQTCLQSRLIVCCLITQRHHKVSTFSYHTIYLIKNSECCI